MKRLQGMKAVVTGSGGKMGGGIALRLAAQGADIVLNDRLAGLTVPYEKDIKEMGVDVISVLANATRREGAETIINTALDRWGRLDILVNVVGGMKGPTRMPIWEMTEEQWEFAIGLNMRGTFHCTQLTIPGMMERHSGKIVNIGSVAWASESQHAGYSTAKGAVTAFTRAVATQLGPYNINVNCVAPGGTIPDRPDLGPEKLTTIPQDADSWKDRVPLGRPNYPGDIGDAVVFLASEEARNVSGALLIVAGGLNPWL